MKHDEMLTLLAFILIAIISLGAVLEFLTDKEVAKKDSREQKIERQKNK